MTRSNQTFSGPSGVKRRLKAERECVCVKVALAVMCQVAYGLYCIYSTERFQLQVSAPGVSLYGNVLYQNVPERHIRG
jgi:hypothetical protein